MKFRSILSLAITAACTSHAFAAAPEVSVTGFSSDLPYKDNREILAKQPSFEASSGTFGITSGAQTMDISVSCGSDTDTMVTSYIWQKNAWGAGKHNPLAQSTDASTTFSITGWNIPPFPYGAEYTIRCEADDYVNSGLESDATEISVSVKPHHPQEAAPGAMTYTSANGSNGILIGRTDENLQIDCATANGTAHQLWFMDEDFNTVLTLPATGADELNMAGLITASSPLFEGHVACVGNSSPPGAPAAFNGDLWYVDTQPVKVTEPAVCSEVFGAPLQAHGNKISFDWVSTRVHYTDDLTGEYLNALPAQTVAHPFDVLVDEGNCFNANGVGYRHCVATGTPAQALHAMPEFQDAAPGASNITVKWNLFGGPETKTTTAQDIGKITMELDTKLYINKPAGVVGRPVFRIKHLAMDWVGTRLYLTPGDYYIEQFSSGAIGFNTRDIIVNGNGQVRLFFKNSVGFGNNIRLNTTKNPDAMFIYAPGNIEIGIGHVSNVSAANGAQVKAYVYAGNQLILPQFGQYRGAYSGKNVTLNFDADVYEFKNPDFTLFEDAGTCVVQ